MFICLAQKKESCVYFSTFLYIQSFPCENPLIGSQLAYFLKLQAVNTTSYLLIRRTLWEAKEFPLSLAWE